MRTKKQNELFGRLKRDYRASTVVKLSKEHTLQEAFRHEGKRARSEKAERKPKPKE